MIVSATVSDSPAGRHFFSADGHVGASEALEAVEFKVTALRQRCEVNRTA
jgi:hypothetical protein